VTDADIYAEVRLDLMRYATALVGVSDAGDLVSAVVTRVLARPGGLSGLDNPKPYLMKSLLNEARMRHRSGQIHAAKLQTLRSTSVDPGHDHVLELVMALPPRQRAAVYLTYYERYPAPEVAELMGCRPATVRRYLFLARQRLREVMDE
jgi:RNA polymerase sigma-70 factor (ECF subfamily)